MRNYMKKNKIPAVNLTADELIAKLSCGKLGKKQKLALFLGTILPIAGILAISGNAQRTQLLYEPEISLASAPISATASKRNLISIPAGTVKANPFVPYRTIESEDGLSDVPKFDLVAPPEAINEGSDAARVMDTLVSGILYDKHSPSAIINIEGNDYLVKKGDVVNSYKIVNIEQNSVTVKLGNNTYKAGIGEILTEGSVNHNDVSNLSKKFGGEKR
ncbi:hypothetical protein IKQ21_01405 [bacterium]|nr:hypothetical protein [bacterium]